MSPPAGGGVGLCRACDSPLRASAKFCPRCGAPTDAESAVESALAAQPSHHAGAAAWEYVKPLVGLYLVYLGTSLVMGLVSRFNESLLLIHAFGALDAIVTLGFCVRFYDDIRPLLALRLPSLAGVVVFLGSSLAFVLLFFAVFRGLDSLGLPFLIVTERYIEAGVPTWLVFVAISIAPAVWEELAFRGVIQTRLAGVLTQTEAWIVQAALFSVLHLSPMIFITHFGMGLMFGWLRDRSNSIYPGMLLHAAWNAVVVVDELNLAL